MPQFGRRALLAAFTAPAGLPCGTSAQSLPERRLTWVVPFAPGNIADAASRAIARRLGHVLGQEVVVVNRPGAGGTIATEAVVRAPSDGRTLLYGGLGPIAIAPHLVPGVRYDPLRDFAPVHGIGAAPLILVTGAGRPWANLAEFFEVARARPEGLSYASPGVGTAQHLAAVALQRAAGLRLIHVPYTDDRQAVNDVMAGRVDVTWDVPFTALPGIRGGLLRALAVTDRTRMREAPEVPTLPEGGVTGAEMLGWAGVFAPARTPQSIVARLSAAVGEALGDAAVRTAFNGTSTTLWPEMDAARFASFLREELPRIAVLVAGLGAR